MSDWGAVRDRVKGILAGLDLEMPGNNGANDAAIVKAVQNGTLPMEKLDLAVERILTIVYKYTDKHAEYADVVFDREADHEKAKKIAEKCIVLLKNEVYGKYPVLPLSGEGKTAVIGGFAKTPRYQGGGSSHINSHAVTNALDILQQDVAKYGDILYAEGFPADRNMLDEKMQAEALAVAEKADRIVVFAGLPDVFESESYDRSHMHLPSCQDALIEKLTKLGKPVIVVLHNGSPVEMPWVNGVQGIVEAYLGGEAVAEALVDILYGKVSPSGKLAETFPLHLEDNPSYLNFPGTDKHVNYAEGIFVGYRYYDTKKMDVLFPFGHGLSYTQFAYSNVQCTVENVDAKALKAGKQTVKVGLDVTNTGSVAGREIVQLYVKDLTKAAIRPEQELKNFASVELQPGETKYVEMELTYRSFAWYDTLQNDWYAADGQYEIRIGRSSRDLVDTLTVTMENAEERPLMINEHVMLGDLMDRAEIRGFVQKKLMPYIAAFIGTDDLDTMTEMEKSMIYYMPLSSLRSFSTMDNEQLHELVGELKEVVGQRA